MDQTRREGYDLEPLDEGRILKQLARYPADELDVMPTRLGNALRAMETYGRERYELNSQDLWYELYAGAAPAMQQEVVGSRVGVDFFVAMFYLTAFYALTALCLAALRGYRHHQPDLLLITEGSGLLLVGPAFCYRAAVSATDYYSGTVRALVNSSRHQLAAAFGLAMPDTMGEEQEMWGLLSDFIVEPDDDSVAQMLDAYRVKREQEGKAPRKQRTTRRAPPAPTILEPDAGRPASPRTTRSTAVWVLIIGLAAVAGEVTGILIATGLVAH